jgi:hypothetical protein
MEHYPTELWNTNYREIILDKGPRGRDRMVVGFTTTYAISAYHHWCCEFESRSGRGVQHYVIKFASDLFFQIIQCINNGALFNRAMKYKL